VVEFGGHPYHPRDNHPGKRDNSRIAYHKADVLSGRGAGLSTDL
jgi:hypothetical protein